MDRLLPLQNQVGDLANSWWCPAFQDRRFLIQAGGDLADSCYGGAEGRGKQDLQVFMVGLLRRDHFCSREPWWAVPSRVTLLHAVATPGWKSWRFCAVSSYSRSLCFVPPASCSLAEADVQPEALQYRVHGTVCVLFLSWLASTGVPCALTQLLSYGGDVSPGRPLAPEGS